jgi:hypothetical protein
MGSAEAKHEICQRQLHTLASTYLARQPRLELPEAAKAIVKELEESGMLLMDHFAPMRMVGAINPKFKPEVLSTHTQIIETEPA